MMRLENKNLPKSYHLGRKLNRFRLYISAGFRY